MDFTERLEAEAFYEALPFVAVLFAVRVQRTRETGA
jgi:hypothetical protein